MRGRSQSPRSTRSSKARGAKTPASARARRPTPGKPKPWTVLVWMAGDNDLDEYGLADIQEMKKVGSTDKLSVIAQFDRAKKHASQRYVLRKGTKLAADSVASLVNRPFYRLAGARATFPICAESSQGIGEDFCRAGAIRAVHSGDVLIRQVDVRVQGDQRRIVPLGDLGKVDTG